MWTLRRSAHAPVCFFFCLCVCVCVCVCVSVCVCFVFYFIKISKFALPGVMLMYERTSKDRKKESKTAVAGLLVNRELSIIHVSFWISQS